MQTYEKPDGTRFVLANSTSEEWADAFYEKLVGVGCSEAYAAKVADGYREAVPVGGRIA